MLQVVFLKGAYVLLVFLELLILLYIICVWLLPDGWLRRTFIEYVGPLFVPFRYLLKKSVIQCKIDISYLLAFLFLAYLKQVLLTLL